jgi:hypothetical protein
MGLKGKIEDFNIAEIIQLIGQQSKTGMLTVRKNNKEVRVFFVNGNVVRVEPDRSERRMLMGEMLITSGKLTREQLESALEEQKGTVQYIGEILLKRKLVTKEDIQKVVQTQIYETIYELFRWKEGGFEFETREKSAYLKILPSLSPEQLLLNVSWMVDEWREIEKTIPTMNVVFEKLPDTPTALVDSEDDERGLTYNQKIIFDLVDGVKTVREIVEKSLMGRFDTCSILSDLLQMGYIRKARIEKAPLYQRIEIKSSRFLFHVLSIILILIAFYAGYRYVNGLMKFKTRHASEMRFLEETYKKGVVIPILYEKFLSYKLTLEADPKCLSDLSMAEFIRNEEAKVLSPAVLQAYEVQWNQSSPF